MTTCNITHENEYPLVDFKTKIDIVATLPQMDKEIFMSYFLLLFVFHMAYLCILNSSFC